MEHLEPAFIDQLKNGDELAFSRLIDLFQDRIYNTVLGILQHQQDAEDVTQEVFIQVFKSVDSFRGDAKLSTWMYRIAVSKAMEWERRKKAKKRFHFFKNLIGEADVETDLADFHHPGVQLQQKEQAALLFSAIRQLPENQRIAFILLKVEGLSYQEAGEIMHKNIKSMEGLMHRAKEQLRRSLKNYFTS